MGFRPNGQLSSLVQSLVNTIEHVIDQAYVRLDIGFPRGEDEPEPTPENTYHATVEVAREQLEDVLFVSLWMQYHLNPSQKSQNGYSSQLAKHLHGSVIGPHAEQYEIQLELLRATRLTPATLGEERVRQTHAQGLYDTLFEAGSQLDRLCDHLFAPRRDYRQTADEARVLGAKKVISGTLPILKRYQDIQHRLESL